MPENLEHTPSPLIKNVVGRVLAHLSREKAIDVREALRGDQEALREAIERVFRELPVEDQKQLREEFDGDLKELRRLFESLEGPQNALERDPGYDRPPFKGAEAKWRVPEYTPVPKDF
jgi:hypothetical protein